jgi:hypothetical protein
MSTVAAFCLVRRNLESVPLHQPVNLRTLRANGIVIIEFESEEPFRQAYETLEGFIADLLRGNEENDTMTCFHFR